jgi:hypothetical protein
MRLGLFALAFVAVPMISFSCGGSPQPIKEVTTLPSSSSSMTAPPAVDLSAVSMPPSVVVLIHAAHVGSSADMIAEWAGQPLDVDQPLSEMVGERIAKLVDLDAASDMTIAAIDRGARREPDVSVAVGLAVKDFDGAKAQLQGEYGLLPIGNGAFEISRSGSHRHDGDSDFRSCALAPGKSGARIVCSRDATSRDAVLPYLTRGIAHLANVKSDLHVEARPGPFRELVRRERASITQSGARFMGGRDFRVAWEAALSDACDSFLDAERATLDATIDSKVGAADLRITAKGSQGLITRILSSHPERAEPPPAQFMRLPDDSDIALFAHGVDADQLAGPRAQFLTAFEEALASEDKLTPGDRKAFTDAMTHTFDLMTTPSLVYARGVDFSKAIPAVTGLTETSDAAKIRAGAEQAAGWEAFGVEGTPEKISAVMKEWVAAVSRPSVASSMKDTKWRVSAAPRNAPAGTIHLALSHDIDDNDLRPQQPNAKPKKRAPIVLTLHTLIVPDGTRAWLVNALDEATAVAKARAIMANAATGTLASRAGLDALKSSRMNAGGFITPRAAGLGLPIMWLEAWNLRYKVTNDPLAGVSAQSQYTTPIIFYASEGAQSDEKSITISLRVTRAVVQEAVAVAPHIFR